MKELIDTLQMLIVTSNLSFEISLFTMLNAIKKLQTPSYTRNKKISV